MLHRIAMLMAAAVALSLLWILPAAAQDAGYTPPEVEPTFFEVPPPESEPPDTTTDDPPDTTTDDRPDTPDNPPAVPPGPPPPDNPADVPPPDDPNLAATGGDVTNGMAAAGVFLVGGTALVLTARRRRKTQE